MSVSVCVCNEGKQVTQSVSQSSFVDDVMAHVFSSSSPSFMHACMHMWVSRTDSLPHPHTPPLPTTHSPPLSFIIHQAPPPSSACSPRTSWPSRRAPRSATPSNGAAPCCRTAAGLVRE